MSKTKKPLSNPVPEKNEARNQDFSITLNVTVRDKRELTPTMVLRAVRAAMEDCMASSRVVSYLSNKKKQKPESFKLNSVTGVVTPKKVKKAKKPVTVSAPEPVVVTPEVNPTATNTIEAVASPTV